MSSHPSSRKKSVKCVVTEAVEAVAVDFADEDRAFESEVAPNFESEVAPNFEDAVAPNFEDVVVNNLKDVVAQAVPEHLNQKHNRE